MSRGAEPIIHPSPLKQAREILTLSTEEAARHIGVPEQVLRSWETGQAEPSLEHLEALAELYGRSLDYFLAERPPHPSEVFLRASVPQHISGLSLEARKVLAQFEELCRSEWELEQLAGEQTEVGFIRQENDRSPEELAEFERARLALDSKPVRNLRELLASQGARVFLLPVPEDAGFSGLSWWHPRYGPAILAKLSDPSRRRNFTFAHEYCHLLREAESQVSICDLSDIESERFANGFAALFLMPTNALRKYWERRLKPLPETDVQALGAMAQEFGVSLEALAIRLEETNLVPRAKSLIQQGHKPRPYPGGGKPVWRRVRGERFVRKALAAYANHRLSTGKLAEYLDIDIRKALQLTATAEGSTTDL